MTSLRDLLTGVSKTYIGTKDQQRSIARLKTAISLLGHPTTPIDTIDTLDIDRVISKLRESSYSPKTINRYLAALSKSFGWAYDRELINRKPKIRMLPEGAGRITYLTQDQEAALVSWLNDNDYCDVSLVTQVLIATGFRIQELLTRKPVDISRDPSGGYWLNLYEGETKNNNSRSAWLSEALGASLIGLMNLGLPSYRRILSGLSEGSIKALGSIVHVTPHVLRHTTATRLNSIGVPTAQVKDIMGHRSLTTTLRYVHNQRDDLRSHMQLLQMRANPLEPGEIWRPRPESNRGARICSPLSKTQVKPK